MYLTDPNKIIGWTDTIKHSAPLAVVMGGSVNGLSFVRSLGRRKIPTLLLDSDPLIGMFTRFGRALILLEPENNDDLWMNLLLGIGRKLPKPGVIFVTSDVHALFLARHENDLAPYYRFLTPDIYIQNKIVNKRDQYTIAQNAGIPIPETHFPESADDIDRIKNDIPYPCILKSYKSHLGKKKISKKVLVVESPDDLSRSFNEYASADVGFMVQEIIPGGDDQLYGYLAMWDRNASEFAWLTKQKLRQSPPLYGDGSLQTTIDAPEVRKLSIELLKQFNYKGFAGVEFKYDERDSTFKLMEINPRTVSGNQISISSGIDFPWIGYRYLTGDLTDSKDVPLFQPGVRYVNEEWDFKAYLALRKTGQLNLWKWLRSILGAKARAIFAMDDPMPLFVVGYRVLRAILRRFTG